MPHPLEVANTLQSMAEVVSDSKTEKNMRRLELVAHRELLRSSYKRAMRLHDVFFTHIASHPDATQEELLEAFSSENLDPEEERLVTQVHAEFIRRFVSSREAFTKLLSTAVDFAKSQGLEEEVVTEELAANILFMIRAQEHPEGDLKLFLDDFSIVMRFFKEKDLRLIEGDRDIYGSYIDDSSIQFVQTDDKSIEEIVFPMILLAPGAGDRTLLHEKVHGHNKAFASGFMHQDLVSLVWGGVPGDVLLEQLVEDKNYSNEQILTLCAQVIHDSILPCIKDEVIAYFAAENVFYNGRSLLRQSRVDHSLVRDENESYGFFESFGIKPGIFTKQRRAFYNILVDQFNTILDENVGFLQRLWAASNRSQNIVTKEELISFMRLTPLDLWRKNGVVVFRDEWSELYPVASEIKNEITQMNSELKKAVKALGEALFLFADDPRAVKHSYEGFVKEKIMKRRASRAWKDESSAIDEHIATLENMIIVMREVVGAHAFDLFDAKDLSAKLALFYEELEKLVERRRHFEQIMIRDAQVRKIFFGR